MTHTPESLTDTTTIPLSRRQMLARLGGLWVLSFMPGLSAFSCTARGTQDDTEILRRVFETLGDPGSIGAAVAAAGRYFLGSLYTAHTIEVPGEERLIVNLREFDCLTLVESCLVIARCIREGDRTMEAFRRELQLIRYRGGTIAGYPSRIHYFTDWIADNTRKGVVQDMTPSIGGVPQSGARNFMSTHPSGYRQLADPQVFDSIQALDARLSAAPWSAVPRDAVPAALEQLQEGDLIGIVSSREGLDIAHTGMIAVEGGTKKFLHAPLSGGAVEISPGSLAEYVAADRGRRGIVAARPREPLKPENRVPPTTKEKS